MQLGKIRKKLRGLKGAKKGKGGGVFPGNLNSRYSRHLIPITFQFQAI